MRISAPRLARAPDPFPWARKGLPAGGVIQVQDCSGSPPVQVDVCWDGVIATVTVSGELDFTNAAGLTGRLLEVTTAHPERLVLDLSDLLFVDVGGARAIDRALRELDDGCPVILRGPHPSARKVFHASGFMQDGPMQRPPA